MVTRIHASEPQALHTQQTPGRKYKPVNERYLVRSLKQHLSRLDVYHEFRPFYTLWRRHRFFGSVLSKCSLGQELMATPLAQQSKSLCRILCWLWESQPCFARILLYCCLGHAAEVAPAGASTACSPRPVRIISIAKHPESHMHRKFIESP